MPVHYHKRKLCGTSNGLHHTLNKYGSHIWDHLCSKGRSSIPYAQNKFILKGNIICFDYVGIWRFMAFFFFSLIKKKNKKNKKYSKSKQYRIAKTAGMIVLNSGGVVRGYTNWGTLLLPARAKKHQATHHFGHYFIMRFDSSGKTQQVIRTTLGLDPRMVKFSVIKLGHRLDQVDKVGGKEWKFSLTP